MELLDYEKRHIDYLKANASECTLFLKRNNEFPLDAPCKVVLLGSGARNTIKGGTGSGDVASRFFKSIEKALTDDGFIITSTDWLNKYDEFKKESKKDYIKDTKRLAKKNHYPSYIYSMGFFEEEKNYNISPDYEGDACIYVLSRNSGEGNDRRNIKGDVKLSDKEKEDILFLNNKFKKFLLVLNVGGVIELGEVENVSNILLLSQLGVVTGDILSGIVLGKYNPSGKLTTTWAKVEDYPSYANFGDLHDTYYKEGIYVGYRYFNTINDKIIYPFGYGLSYTDFSIDVLNKSLSKNILNITCKVKNIGKFSGKEVVQVYVTKPNDLLDNPYIELCDYQKTKLLKSNEEEELTFSIDINSFKVYDEKRALYVLPKGKYIIRIGNSSINLSNVCKLILNEEIELIKLDNKLTNNEFDDLKLDRINEDLSDLDEFIIDSNYFTLNKIEYKLDDYIDPLIEKLDDDALAYMCIGNYDNGLAAMVGGSSKHVIGGAGETTLRVKEVTSSLTMSDGPAGIRIKQAYGIDKKGVYDVTLDPLMEKMIDFLPKLSKPFILPPKNRHGEIHYQYTTAIPIGTALAQSFSDSFVSGCGDIVAFEMEKFGIDLWLAPALNIHRNVLCGRNFEYYSEDPLVSGRVASSITRTVEAKGNLGVTIKHFACNNQEINRNNNNSHLSERALREIYLKGFEKCIKESNPKAIMTSYNLINGTHASESRELINDILRCEWGYTGLVMTDWIKTGRSFCKKIKYDAPYAHKNILAGNDLTMPGSPKDHRDIINALKKGKISHSDLVHSASRIYRSIKTQKK